MNKMVINHLEKLFVTSDASTIVNELEIQHPAARLIVLAAQAQEQEIGDATNFVSLTIPLQYYECTGVLLNCAIACRFWHLLESC
jgi:chaperonin GroEL (HSP60 family)